MYLQVRDVDSACRGFSAEIVIELSLRNRTCAAELMFGYFLDTRPMTTDPLSMGNPFEPPDGEHGGPGKEGRGFGTSDKSSFVKFGTSQFVRRDNRTVLTAGGAYGPECRMPRGPFVNDSSNSIIFAL